MADIENYTLNFGSGRVLRTLNLADAKLAFAEIERGSLPARIARHG